MRSILSSFAARLRRDQRGATAVEYGIMVSLIAVVIIVAVTLLGGTLSDTFTRSSAPSAAAPTRPPCRRRTRHACAP